MVRVWLPFVVLLLLLQRPWPTRALNPLAPAIYVFGDSLSDNGNNNNLPTPAKANYSPYGKDFLGPTGRFSNGKTMVDHIAEGIGLPFAPPYLGLSDQQRKTIRTGINYASAACGILNMTGYTTHCIPLAKQISFFQKTVEDDLPHQFESRQALNNHLAKSIFVIIIGSNDYLNNYFRTDYYNTSKIYSPEEFSMLLIERLHDHVKKIHGLGARKFVIFDVGPIGCTAMVTRNGNPCSKAWNDYIDMYNTILSALLKELQYEMQNAIFVHAEGKPLVVDMHQNPSRYGFTFTREPCCMTNLQSKTTVQCIPGITACKYKDMHIYWDLVHPTERVNSIVAKNCFNHSLSICKPMTIHQLVLA